MPGSLAQLVRERAAHRCEYCRLPESAAETPFQLDHIVAQQHGGATILENLAWACFYCNKYKGPNAAGFDPDTGLLTRLFHPRKDDWRKHFRWNGAALAGVSPEGRAAVVVLGMNRPLIVARRVALLAEGLLATKDDAAHDD